jgi:hypothetical protein
MESPMPTTKRKPNLNLLLTHYDYTIDFDQPHRLVVQETDILLSSRGNIDKLNYMYLVRPATDDKEWLIYLVKNKIHGYLPSKFSRNSQQHNRLVKQIKKLIS